MALNRQQLPQRIFNLHHCIAAERAKWKRAANAIAKTRIALRCERPQTATGIKRAPTGFTKVVGLGGKAKRTDEGRRALTEGRQASANASRLRRASPNIERTPLFANGGRFDHKRSETGQNGDYSKNRGSASRREMPPALSRGRSKPSVGASARLEMPFREEKTAHRLALFANGDRFDHKRAGAGQNRRHLQKISSQSAEDGSSRDLFNHNPVGPNRPDCQSSSDGQATQPGKFIGPGQSPHQPRSASLSARFEQLVSSTRAPARQLRSTNSWRTFRAR